MNYQKTKPATVTFLFLASLIFLFVDPVWAQNDYLDFTNPFQRKIPLAIPPFAKLSGNAQETVISESCEKLLTETLAFTGFFNIMDRNAFLDDPSQSGIDESKIKFTNWTGIGAELLITGGVLTEGDKFSIELRLFDTFKGKLLVGKKYPSCQPNDQRRVIFKFCSAVLQHLTGKSGFFDSKIAFVSTGSGHKELYICEFDGYDPKRITNSNSITLSPAWSSDGRWLAYTSFKKGKPDLYIQNLKTNDQTVVDQKGINITPAWVPGEFNLAATLSYTGDQEIYLLTGTGKIIKRLTNKYGIDVSPAFSPDGKKMAFVSNRSGNPQIYVADLDSGNAERLTFDGNYNVCPSWSPGGNKIAYASIKSGYFDICIIDKNGQNLIQLTKNSGNNESPSWSPDGSLIVFSSTREGLSRVYVMTAYGTDQRRLLTLPGEQSNPKWSPNTFN